MGQPTNAPVNEWEAGLEPVTSGLGKSPHRLLKRTVFPERHRSARSFPSFVRHPIELSLNGVTTRVERLSVLGRTGVRDYFRMRRDPTGISR